MKKRFEGKNVVISGATSGIGRVTSIKFAEEGANVYLLGRNVERGNDVVDCISVNGGSAHFVECDVSNSENVSKACSFIMKETEGIDVLFNNAGIMLPSHEIEKMPLEDWERTITTNLNGVFYVTRLLKEYIVRNKGNIINNASIAGLQYYAAGRSYAYSASKAAVIQFSHQMAKNYGEEGVRVNCICPGIIDTPILGNRDRKIYAERIPLKYVGNPSQVANVVMFLASDEASYVTGAIVNIDGGASL